MCLFIGDSIFNKIWWFNITHTHTYIYICMKKICDDDREKSDGLTIACQPLRTRTPGTAMGFQTAGRAFLQGIFFFFVRDPWINYGDPQGNQRCFNQNKVYVISFKKPALTKLLVWKGAAVWSMASAAVSTSKWDDAFLEQLVVFSHPASTSPSTQ